MIVPLLKDAVAGHSFIDPEIESRVQEVRHKDEQSPMSVLEPNEQAVARMLAQGMTNEQIAARMGFRDKRTISRTNGQIYCRLGSERHHHRREGGSHARRYHHGRRAYNLLGREWPRPGVERARRMGCVGVVDRKSLDRKAGESA